VFVICFDKHIPIVTVHKDFVVRLEFQKIPFGKSMITVHFLVFPVLGIKYKIMKVYYLKNLYAHPFFIMLFSFVACFDKMFDRF